MVRELVQGPWPVLVHDQRHVMMLGPSVVQYALLAGNGIFAIGMAEGACGFGCPTEQELGGPGAFGGRETRPDAFQRFSLKKTQTQTLNWS